MPPPLVFEFTCFIVIGKTHIISLVGDKSLRPVIAFYMVILHKPFEENPFSSNSFGDWRMLIRFSTHEQ